MTYEPSADISAGYFVPIGEIFFSGRSIEAQYNQSVNNLFGGFRFRMFTFRPDENESSMDWQMVPQSCPKMSQLNTNSMRNVRLKLSNVKVKVFECLRMCVPRVSFPFLLFIIC